MPAREHETGWDAMWGALRAAATGTAVPNADRTAVHLGAQQGAPGLVALGLGDEPAAGSGTPHETLRVLHAALGDARIPHVFFKGPFADLVLWGGRGLRGGLDVDVLVPRDDEERALAALSRAGFTRARSHGLDASAAASKARRLLPPIPALHEVDLHLRPLNDPPFPARAADVFASARDYLVDGAAIPGPDPAVMLVWSAGNLAGGRLQGLVRQAADAARMAHLFSIDWARVVTTARAWRASAATWGFLRLLEERLGVEVPHATLAALAPPGPVGRVIERVFGVAGAPLTPDNVILGIFAVEWALSGRALWPAERILRTGALRIADHVLDALEGSRAPSPGANVAGATPARSAVPVAMESKIKVPPDVLMQEIDGESVLLDLRTETYFGLDEVGTLLFRALREQGTLAAAVEAGLAAFDVEREELARDLLELVEQLAAQGLVVVEP